jgi:hypothetical protein
MGKEKIIPILAFVILIIAGTSQAYVFITQNEKETLTINNEEYTIDQLFIIGETKTIQTIEGEKSGVSFEDLMNKIGIECTDCHTYTIIGSDGYQQTVEWELMKTGVISDDKTVYFPDTAKKFWVKDIIEIEVK